MSDGYYVDRFGSGNYLALKFEDIDPDVTSLLVGLQGEQTEFDFNTDEYYVLKVKNPVIPPETSDTLVITAVKSDNTSVTKEYSIHDLIYMDIHMITQYRNTPDSYEGNTCDAYLDDDYSGMIGFIKMDNAMLQLDFIAEDSNGESFDQITYSRYAQTNNFELTIENPGEDISWIDIQIIASYIDSETYGDAEFTVGVRLTNE